MVLEKKCTSPRELDLAITYKVATTFPTWLCCLNVTVLKFMGSSDHLCFLGSKWVEYTGCQWSYFISSSTLDFLILEKQNHVTAPLVTTG